MCDFENFWNWWISNHWFQSKVTFAESLFCRKLLLLRATFAAGYFSRSKEYFKYISNICLLEMIFVESSSIWYKPLYSKVPHISQYQMQKSTLTKPPKCRVDFFVNVEKKHTFYQRFCQLSTFFLVVFFWHWDFRLLYLSTLSFDIEIDLQIVEKNNIMKIVEKNVMKIVEKNVMKKKW